MTLTSTRSRQVGSRSGQVIEGLSGQVKVKVIEGLSGRGQGNDLDLDLDLDLTDLQ